MTQGQLGTRQDDNRMVGAAGEQCQQSLGLWRSGRMGTRTLGSVRQTDGDKTQMGCVVCLRDACNAFPTRRVQRFSNATFQTV